MNTFRRTALVALILLLAPLGSSAVADPGRDALWAAVRNGDVQAIQAAIDKGADVNAKNEIGITALWIAGSKGKREVIELLVKRGADVNARDGIWYQTPLSSAVQGGHADAAILLIKAGASDLDAALITAAARRQLAIVQEVLRTGKASQDALDAARFGARPENKELREALVKAGAKELPRAGESDRNAWKPLAGSYENDNGGKLTIEVGDFGLMIRSGFGSGQVLKPLGPDRFAPLGSDSASLTFERAGDKVPRVIYRRFTAESSFYRTDLKPVAQVAQVARLARPLQAVGDGRITTVVNWPSFRGPDATGVADGQQPPLTWNVEQGQNVRWKTAIPGLGHSCPIVWGDRVFLTTAVSGDPNPKVRTGNYGDVASVNDTTQHTWHVLCLDRDTGRILWNRQAFEGLPKIKRHLKGSQANCTPATDGTRVVACFGSEGLYCYDFEGRQLWKRDLSTVDSSFAMDREYEWGFGSSPIIHEGLVILQCDLSKDSFIAAYSLEDGALVWSTPRDEIPSWSSPALWRTAQGVQLVTNAAQYARGYDPRTGQELWRLAKKSEVTIPAPVPGKDLLFITSGNRPIQPIFAIRPGAAGDISLKDQEDRNAHIAWSRMRGGPYMPTPILYGDYLYTIGNAGIVTCYQAATGKEVYKERLGGVSYTASPVAADGRLYFLSEQGQVRVVKAGPSFQLLAANEVEDVCLATPAISAGMLFVRSQKHLFALGRTQAGKSPGAIPGRTDFEGRRPSKRSPPLAAPKRMDPIHFHQQQILEPGAALVEPVQKRKSESLQSGMGHPFIGPGVAAHQEAAAVQRQVPASDNVQFVDLEPLSQVLVRAFGANPERQRAGADVARDQKRPERPGQLLAAHFGLANEVGKRLGARHQRMMVASPGQKTTA